MGDNNLAYRFGQQEIDSRVEQTKKKQRARAKRDERIKSFKKMVCAILIAASAFLMISRYVELYETEKEIDSLKTQLAEAESVTAQKMFELESSVDLKTIEEEATTRLGMQRPEKYQIIYVNVKKDDETEITANEVEGIRSRLLVMADKAKQNIIGIFSIN